MSLGESFKSITGHVTRAKCYGPKYYQTKVLLSQKYRCFKNRSTRNYWFGEIKKILKSDYPSGRPEQPKYQSRKPEHGGENHRRSARGSQRGVQRGEAASNKGGRRAPKERKQAPEEGGRPAERKAEASK